MITTQGITSYEFKDLQDILIKSNNIQLQEILRQTIKEIVKRRVIRHSSITI